MKIAIISHSYLDSENRKNVHELAKHAEVKVIIPRGFRVSRTMKLTLGGSDLDTDRIWARRTIRVWGAQYLFLSPTLGFRRFKPDIIHVEYDPWSLVVWQVLVARRLFAPQARLVCTVKKNTYRRYQGLVTSQKERVAKAGIGRVDRFLAASEMAARLYKDLFHVPADKIEVVTHLGIDGEVFRPAESSTTAVTKRSLTVGFCGWFGQHKGIWELVEAVQICRTQMGMDLELQLLGAGALNDDLSWREAETSWLRVFPPVPNSEVPHFLQGLDIFVLPSLVLADHEEHDAHALLEAMAVGVPSVGTRSGIIPELLGNGAGLLVEPGNIHELADAIAQLGRDPDARQRLSDRARERVERESLVPTVAKRKAEAYGRA